MKEEAASSPVAVSFRPRAIRDIEEQEEYLSRHAPPEIAARFRAALENATGHLAAHPFSGAPRDARNPRLAGLRMWGLPGFRNYLLFYVMPGGRVEIIRLLHGAQDVLALFEAYGEE